LSSCINGQLTVQIDSQGFLSFVKGSKSNIIESLKSAVKNTAESILGMYVGNNPGHVPGIFLPVDVYYWWLGGAVWNVITSHESQDLISRHL
jgi:hypothetical protein